MKRIVFSFLFLASFFSTPLFASKVEVKCRLEQVTAETYVLDLGNLEKYAEKDITAEVEKLLKELADDESKCSVTVKGFVMSGFSKYEISVSVSGPGNELKSKGKEIASELIFDLKKHLKKRG